LTLELNSIRTKLRIHHFWGGVWKACLFFAIGYAVANGEATVERLIFAGIAVLFVVTLLEYLWFYRPIIKKHTELLERFGDEYEQKLIESIEELGYDRIVNSSWISRCYDEMMG
jgi:hypothetical protein